MRNIHLPPNARYALLAIIALFVASFNIIPDVIVGIGLLAIGVLQGADVWQRLQKRAQSSNVTYWRGVRYEVSNTPKRPQWRDIQAEGLWILLTLIATIIGVVLVVDSFF
jgi:hypothetical protein